MACRSAVTGHELEDVSWSDVIKVEMHCQFPAVCTRCGQRPFMPRIGLCGHVYCFPCIWIRIAFDHDERVETCPACGRSLKTADLKRVSTFQSYVPKVGDNMKFQLMRRDIKVVNSYVVDIWTANYHSHLTIREVFQPLRHLPLGRTFYFVVLDFDAPIFSDNEYLQTNYEKALVALSKSQSNISAAVGHYVNNKLLKRKSAQFVDVTLIPKLTLPSGSQAFFTDPLLRKYLQGDLPESQ
ncbi:unnamed protein product [Taenia asiatica]|uniref:E3 ubiquitin-protein ligase RNF10 n=1 Tax=Taenia asiatica TaxID=60517 RepID=A0A0R3WEC0_TAEAS|nr:unnamed protein product [Taenia asiatica]